MDHWIEHFKEKWYDTDKRRMGFIMYFGCLFLYGFLFHDGEIYDKLLRYSKTIIVCVILYLLLYAMERVSLKKLFSRKCLRM